MYFPVENHDPTPGGGLLWASLPGNPDMPTFVASEEEEALQERDLALARRLEVRRALLMAADDLWATAPPPAPPADAAAAAPKDEKGSGGTGGGGGSSSGGSMMAAAKLRRRRRSSMHDPRRNSVPLTVPKGAGDVWIAAREGDAHRLRYLLEVAKVPVGRVRLPFGATALHRAAEEGQIACIELLLAYGADPNCKTCAGWATPLHLACARGHGDAAVLLLEHGARWEVMDKWRRTPLDLAVKNGFPEVARRLDTLYAAGAAARQAHAKAARAAALQQEEAAAEAARREAAAMRQAERLKRRAAREAAAADGGGGGGGGRPMTPLERAAAFKAKQGKGAGGRPPRSPPCAK